MSRRSWSDADTARLAMMANASVPELAAAFPDRSIDAVVSKLSRMARTEPSPAPSAVSDSEPDHIHPNFSTAPNQRIDVCDLLSRAATRTAKNPGEADKDYAQVTIQTDKPIAVMKSADWHFGARDVDYAALLTHVKFLLDVPGFYLQLFGDDLNLMIMHRTVSTRVDIMTPKEQIQFLESFVAAAVEKGKLLSMGWGNHSDEFTERSAGFGIVDLIVNQRVPYFRGLGYLDLTLEPTSGEPVTYPMAFAHKTRFSSFMNPLHGNKRMEQMHAELFGINRPIAHEYITAHTHNPAYSTEGALPEQRIHFIKCGTFKTDCTYSQRFFGQGRIGVPTVVYHPDRFEHVCLPTPWEAYRYMQGHDWEGGA